MAAGWGDQAKRYGAPLAFLLAVTVAVLLVRDGLNTGDAASDTTPTATLATTPTVAKPVPPKRRRYYRLRSGETLSDVAIKFHTTVAALVALNHGVRPTNLTIGQRLRVK